MTMMSYTINDIEVLGFYPLRPSGLPISDTKDDVRIILQIEDSFDIWLTDYLDRESTEERVEEVMAHFISVLMACGYLEHPEHLVSWQVLDVKHLGC